MTKIFLMLNAHQPIRISEYSFFDLGKHKSYFNEKLNRFILNRISDNCYLPLNNLLKKLTKEYGNDFRFSISLSGTTLEQLETFRPDVLESFKEVVAYGNVEMVCTPYHYSLASFYSKDEFSEQVKKHRKTVFSLFGKQAMSFLNTEFLYNNEIADLLQQLGFKTVVAEGADWILRGKSPNQAFRSVHSNMNIFLRNYRISDDIKFRYSDFTWPDYPLTAAKFSKTLKREKADAISLFFDCENFGEHHKREGGIFDFLEKTLTGLLHSEDFTFSHFQDEETDDVEREVLDVPFAVSRADVEKDLSAWKGNSMQHETLVQVYSLEEKLKMLGDTALLDQWRMLQTADHFYYMSTKKTFDGKVHKYFSPFGSPHDSYRYFMNILSDFELLVNKRLGEKPRTIMKKVS